MVTEQSAQVQPAPGPGDRTGSGCDGTELSDALCISQTPLCYGTPHRIPWHHAVDMSAQKTPNTDVDATAKHVAPKHVAASSPLTV